MAENVKGQNRDRNQGNENKKNRRIMPDSDLTSSNSDHQNASANRGGTTDMGSNALRHATGNTTRANKGSGITTKRSVTGSDYDGQVSEG
ncbi:hypothetical protein [Flavisolibacter tropicus]|uniref:Uncharacterized protein n=1 Tax=Flavisolibacter tropicus TaxID=1492898 RepID=A0A172TYN0_9BACT|nr:hypothetical protein [Flavisolibacter tropicus]ANE52185.1 hypothetical protein SY85_18490 [Flavisolibacter tropicus]